MGLSTKQVSGDGIDWGQSLFQAAGGLELPKPPPARRPPPQQHRSEPLPCPRCGSTNTKFCYYNNYNKSQPRHFCKACKRHWTKGGTLRNVPVGGGRKNKRLKTASATAAVASPAAAAGNSAGTIRSDTHMGHQSQEQCQNLSQTLGDQKSISVSEILYQTLMVDSINNTGNLDVKCLGTSNGEFLGSTLPLLQNQNPVPFVFSSGLSSFERNSSSISTSIGSSDAYNFTGGLVSMEDSTITTTMPTTSAIPSQPWQIVPITSSVTDMPNYWNWDDIGSLVNTTDLNIPWDDTDEIKP